jgi:hypothetical protein
VKFLFRIAGLREESNHETPNTKKLAFRRHFACYHCRTVRGICVSIRELITTNVPVMIVRLHDFLLYNFHGISALACSESESTNTLTSGRNYRVVGSADRKATRYRKAKANHVPTAGVDRGERICLGVVGSREASREEFFS